MKIFRKSSWLLAACFVALGANNPVQAQFSLPGVADVLSAFRPAGNADLQDATQAEAAGQWDRAAESYARALASLDRAPNAWTPMTLLTVLPAYGRVLARLGRLDEAEVVLQRAVNMPLQPGSGGSPLAMPNPLRVLAGVFSMGSEMSRSMNHNLLLLDDDDIEKAGSLLAPRVPQARQALTLLAEVHARQGKGDKVLDSWQGPFSKYLAHIDASDPEMRVMLAYGAEVETLRMANALAASGSPEQARAAMQRAMQFNASRLRFFATSPVLEAQLAGFQQRRVLVSALATQSFRSPMSAEQAQDLVEAIASSKALGSRYVQRRRALLATDVDRHFSGARARMATLDNQLMQMPQTGEAGVAAWVQWSNYYSAALAPAMPGLERAGLSAMIGDGSEALARTRQQLVQAGWIGFVQYNPVDPQTSALGPARYLRYTVTPVGLTVKDLGLRRPIDQAITAWRGAIDGKPSAAGTKLAQLLLADLGADVQSRKDWIIEPDGLIALLPFEALPNGADRLVVEQHTVRYATSMAHFADSGLRASTAGKGTARIIADARYDRQNGAAAGMSRLRDGSNKRLGDLLLAPLPETRQEGEAVEQALESMGIRSEMRTGADATVDAFAFTTAPQFLHVATHGFLLAPALDMDPLQKHRVSVLVPGLMAGLALTPAPRGDFLMAQDLAGLNLRGTQLVVLSACDTGNGQVDVGEGLTSLRRATEEAGARASLTSLWPVPSQVTVKLMTDFYRHLAAGQSHSQALQLAKLKVRNSGGSIRDWAGFVLAGADR